MTNITVTNLDEKTKSGIFCRKTLTQTSGDVLVLVMGYGGSLRIWPQSFVEKLAEKFVVVTYDNRGTGLSIVPEDPREYTMQTMASDIEHVVETLELSRFHMLGYSMGGCIALQYAHDYANRIMSLILLSSTAGGPLYVKPQPELSAALANPQGNTLWELYMNTFRLMYSPEALQRCEPTLRGIFESSKDLTTSPQALLGHTHAFRSFDGSSYLSGLKIPTTILAGEDDRLMPVGNSQNMANAIPNSKLVLLPGVEHGAHVQEESRVIKEIENACLPH